MKSVKKAENNLNNLLDRAPRAKESTRPERFQLSVTTKKPPLVGKKKTTPRIFGTLRVHICHYAPKRITVFVDIYIFLKEYVIKKITFKKSE